MPYEWTDSDMDLSDEELGAKVISQWSDEEKLEYAEAMVPYSVVEWTKLPQLNFVFGQIMQASDKRANPEKTKTIIARKFLLAIMGQ